MASPKPMHCKHAGTVHACVLAHGDTIDSLMMMIYVRRRAEVTVQHVQLLTTLTRLRSLKLMLSGDAPPGPLHELTSLSVLPGLQALELVGPPVTGGLALTALRSLAHLTSLALVCLQLDREAFGHIAMLTGLQHLSIERCAETALAQDYTLLRPLRRLTQLCMHCEPLSYHRNSSVGDHRQSLEVKLLPLHDCPLRVLRAWRHQQRSWLVPPAISGQNSWLPVPADSMAGRITPQLWRAMINGSLFHTFDGAAYLPADA
ncbi:hypothetical protein MMC07_002616 [Pseudocyphellaria aurata]|nr:hypothetical protein [Pseudocyphellaria aurata]